MGTARQDSAVVKRIAISSLAIASTLFLLAVASASGIMIHPIQDDGEVSFQVNVMCDTPGIDFFEFDIIQVNCSTGVPTGEVPYDGPPITSGSAANLAVTKTVDCPSGKCYKAVVQLKCADGSFDDSATHTVECED
jgi:hypothetical protein